MNSNPNQMDWEKMEKKMEVERIGYRLVEKEEEQYIGAKVASWELDLKLREGHFELIASKTQESLKVIRKFISEAAK